MKWEQPPPPIRRGKILRKNNLLIFGFVGALTAALFPIFIYPYFYPEYWQNIQKEARKGIDQEKIQPGGMKVWSDPFDRPKK